MTTYPLFQKHSFLINAVVLFFYFLATPTVIYSQESDTLKQSGNDTIIQDYDYFLKELNSDNFDIDYRDFRISYIKSDAFKKKGIHNYDSLKSVVYQNISDTLYKEVIRNCQLMLEADYTSMFGHKYIQQTAKVIGDTNLYKKHHAIEFGLLRSIVNNGDGKTCATSWEVTQLEEEYFILGILNAKLIFQALNGGCDEMHVKIKGEKKEETYYFGVYYVFLSRRL